MGKFYSHSLVFCVFAAVILLSVQVAFAEREPLTEEQRMQMGRIEVATPRFSPTVDLKALARARGVDATQAEVATIVITAIEQLSVQTRLSELFLKHGQALGAPLMKASQVPGPTQSKAKLKYRDLAAEGIDTIIEPALLEVKAGRPPKGKPSGLWLEAQVRLVQTRKGRTLFKQPYQFWTPELTATQWVADEAAVLRRVIEEALDAFAQEMVTDIFFTYDLPQRRWGGFHGGYGLGPEHPPQDLRFLLANPFSHKPPCSPGTRGISHSLRPKVQWEAFPTDNLVRELPDLVSRISKVTYDFRLSGPGMTYAREGLATNSHRLEVTLQPDTIYWWTVRARFEVDGQSRVTVWGTVMINPTYFKWLPKPGAGSYCFRTPS